MNRFHVLRIARVSANGGVHDLRVLLHLRLKESVRTIAIKQRQERCDQGLDVTVDRERNAGTASQLFRMVFNLDGEGVRQELIVGEVGTQHDEDICIIHALSCCTVTQQTCHTHIKGVVVLDEVLATQGVANRCLQSVGKLDDLVMSAFHTCACKDCNLLRPIENICELADIFLIWAQHGASGRYVLR